MSKAKTAAKPAPQVVDDLNVEIPEVDFTPEQEAALDVAAKGGTPDPVKVEVDDTSGAAAGPTAEEQIAALNKQLADEKAMREKLERERKEFEVKKVDEVKNQEVAEMQRFKLAEDKLDGDKQLAARELDDAKRAYREAYESGDTEKVLEAQDKLFDAKTKIRTLDENEAGLKKFKEDRERFWKNTTEQTKRKAENGDEIQLNREDFTSAAWDWVEKHPEFKTDKAFHEKAIRAHYAAIGDNITEDTPEYFAFIEKRLGLSDDASAEDIASEAAAKGEVTVEVKKSEPTKKATPSAPVSRGTPDTRQSINTRIKRLSAVEAEAADFQGISHEEYWDSKNVPEDEFVRKYGYSNKQ